MKRVLRAFVFATRGIVVAIKEQFNLKIQLAAGCIVTGMGFYFEITALEWCVLVLTMGLVIGLEIINSAIENLVDLVMPERNSLAGKVKDMAAGAVFVAAMLAVIIGFIIFGKYIINLIGEYGFLD